MQNNIKVYNKKVIALVWEYISQARATLPKELVQHNCYVPTQLFLACTCVYLFLVSPVAIFLELDFLLWNIVLEVSGPVYNLITRNYATDFNMNFLEVSLLL